MNTRDNKINKIFGIGLGHTGTRSFDQALYILGIKSIHWPLDRRTYRELSSGVYSLNILNKYQAISDITVVPFYRQLDKAYPGSKFILTVRDREAWIGSMKKRNQIWVDDLKRNRVVRSWRFLLREAQAYRGMAKFLCSRRFIEYIIDINYRIRIIEFQRMQAYGALVFDEANKLLEVYDAHYKGVLDYFKDRPGDLLVMNICNGDGWGRLCPFLSKPVPDIPFPHVKHKS